jgi:hypothetical protein
VLQAVLVRPVYFSSLNDVLPIECDGQDVF